ncbi:hypothetical protein SDC9_143332 [bioreactor metagenome]|uniref:Uncharacterized protein n=1 Tax=bioreactor metagenome TaxID=1076179 RepID=A0A645E2Z4_9ZZZZ
MVTATTSSCLFKSSIVIPFPSLISCICNLSLSFLKDNSFSSSSAVSLSLSTIPACKYFCLVSKAVSLLRPSISSDFLRKRKRRFSRFLFKSSYFFTPRTSLYAEHNLLFSSMVFVSASVTIFSESKKKKRATSLFKIKSLINTSCPISEVSSFFTPTIRISTVSSSRIMS